MSASSPRAPWNDPAGDVAEEVDAPILSKTQKKRRRLGRGRARAKLRQEEQMMQAESRNNAPEDEQNPSAVSSEASSEAELEVANDYYRRIIAARSTESHADQQASICSSSANEEEVLRDLREIELGESAMTQMGAPSRNECLSTVSTTVLNIPDTRERDNVVQEVAAPKWSKSQKKRRRQGKKRRALALARLLEQEQFQSSPPAFDTQERRKSSSMTSPTKSSTRDTEATVGIRLMSDQAGRHPSIQASRQYLGHGIPTTSDPNAPMRGPGLSKSMTLNSSGPLPESQRTSASNFVDNDLSMSDAKLCAKASQSDGGP